jgi:hypothetical protein
MLKLKMINLHKFLMISPTTANKLNKTIQTNKKILQLPQRMKNQKFKQIKINRRLNNNKLRVMKQISHLLIT